MEFLCFLMMRFITIKTEIVLKLLGIRNYDAHWACSL
jgi:hypothetical protein